MFQAPVELWSGIAFPVHSKNIAFGVSQPRTGQPHSFAVLIPDKRFDASNAAIESALPIPTLQVYNRTSQILSPPTTQHGSHGMAALGTADNHLAGPHQTSPPPLTSFLPPPPPPPPPPLLLDTVYQSHKDDVSSSAEDLPFDQENEATTYIENKQDQLQDVRDELVGSRFRLEAERQELRKLREKAGHQAGSAFTKLQTLLHQQSLDITKDVIEAFTDAAQLRDKLGSKETEYDEKEHRYNLLEWKYTKIERSFVQEFSAKPNAQLSTPSILPAQLDEIQGITRFSLGVSETIEAIDRAYTTNLNIGDDFFGSKSTTTEETEGSPVPLKTTNWPRLRHASASESLESENIVGHNHPRPPPFSDSVLTYAEYDWLETRKHIETWLFEALVSSPLEKARLRHVLDRNDIDERVWWKLVKQHWPSESSVDCSYHTEGSTVLSGDTSLLYSSNVMDPIMNPISSASEHSRTGGKASLVQSLNARQTIKEVPASLVQDDVSRTTALFEAPILTLQEPGEEMATPMALQPTISAGSSHATSHSPVPRRASQDSELSQDSQEGNSENFVQLVQTQGGLEMTPQHLDVPPSQATLPHSRHDATPNSPVSSPDTSSPRKDSVLSLPPSANAQRPLSPPPTTRSNTPEYQRRKPRQCPFDPFFRTDSTSSWGYFLRLTPFLACSCEGRAHRLQDISFVSGSNSREADLPGPSSSTSLFD